ncbi:MAG: translation initiation factor [Sulfurimonas sp.]|nr:translation initiation factor [Sulfurimonas sp.]
MSRGKKLDLFIGADIDDSWAEIQSPRKSIISNEIIESSSHQLFFSKEKRKGKIVTLVGEFHMQKDDCAAILKILKKKLGCGGTYKDNFMEFQGELKDKIRPLLIHEGFKFKSKH